MEHRFTNEYIEELAAKYRSGSLNAREKADFDRWYGSFNDAEFVHRDAANPEGVKQRMYDRIAQGMGEDTPQVKPWRISYLKIGIAASLAMVLSALWLYTRKPEIGRPVPASSTTSVREIAPATVGATLTLADGKKIRLSEANSGELAEEAGVTISKSAEGELIYQTGLSAKASENASHTLNTSRGETYQVKLPDGSKVWLNAASSLSYTASLVEDGKRIVRLQGEGYFEISKDEKHPFVVKTSQQEVEVLGTHFNVNAYRDEAAVKTTLLEGRVKVSAIASGRSGALETGQSASVSGATLLVNKKANLQEAIAWKEGKFQYDQMPIKALMRQVERWYDVEVVYKGEIPDKKYVGTISRTLPLQKFLEILSYTGLKFKVEDRKIIVAP